MSVFKRGNVWWYRFRWNSEEIRESTKQSNKRIAEQMEAAHKTSLAKGEVGLRERKKAPTLAKFAPDFERAIENQCAEKPRTVDFYKGYLKKLLKSPLASVPLDEIDEAAVERYRQELSQTTTRRDRPIAPATVNREMATLRRLLRLAYKWKVIERVPMLERLTGERTREFVLSKAIEPVYLAALPPQLCEVAILLLETGLRLGEALSLDWRQVHIDPVGGALFGYLTVLAGKSKNKRSRNIPLSDRAADVLRRAGPKPEGLVFQREDETELRAAHLGQQHKRVRDRLKLPEDFVLHSLRHTFGTRLGESGADAFSIMKLMGHSSITVSQRYVHPSPEAIERTFAKFIGFEVREVRTKTGTVKASKPLELQ